MAMAEIAERMECGEDSPHSIRSAIPAQIV
jgi:hypothetical protein